MKKDRKKIKEFEAIYHKYYQPLARFAIKLVGNYDDANDICQEVFVSFHEKMDTVLEPQKWLFGTLRYKVYNLYRSKKVKTVDIDGILETELPTSNGDSLDIQILLYEMLDNEENFKDTVDRILLDLIAFQGYSYEKAGKKIGISKDQARYKYNKLIERLNDYLKKSGIKDIEALLCMIIMIMI